MRHLVEQLGHVLQRAVSPEESPPPAAHLEDLQLVRQAHQEWLAAKAYFEEVAEPELVDHAIALLTATERRYAYLLQQARRRGVTDAELRRALGIALPPEGDLPGPTGA